MQSLRMINELSTKLNEEGISSHDDMRKLNEENKLEELMNMPHFNEVLKYEITQYLDFLFDESFKYRYLKKIRLEEMTKGKYNWTDLFMLSLYSGDEKSYRNLPVLLENLINKLNIGEYKYVSKEDLTSAVYRNFDIRDGYDRNIEKDICQIDYKFASDKYDKYDSIYNSNTTNVNNMEEFSIWAEHKAFEDEYNLLKKYGIENYTTWVARYHGDGYGFDVLTIELDTNKEKLIEVKSGKYEDFSLTENETNVMRNCHFKGAEYYIYKYTYYADTNTIGLNMFRYNPKLDMLVDQNNNYFSLRKYQDYDERGNIVNKFTIDKVELCKQKTITK